MESSGRSLVPAETFEMLVSLIITEEGLPRPLAERIVTQTLAFLAASAGDRHPPLLASRMVDIGWRTFVLQTRPYAEFCDRVAGRFIHYPGEPEFNLRRLLQAMDAIRAAGYAVDNDMWFLVVESTMRGTGS